MGPIDTFYSRRQEQAQSESPSVMAAFKHPDQRGRFHNDAIIHWAIHTPHAAGHSCEKECEYEKRQLLVLSPVQPDGEDIHIPRNLQAC